MSNRFKQIYKYVRTVYSSSLFVQNYFETEFSKRVLISYLTSPFLKGEKIDHSSQAECKQIAEIFNKMGYIVDIIEYNSVRSIKHVTRLNYDVVFGLEPNFLNAVKIAKPKKSIYYATGAYYQFQNKSEDERIAQIKKRHGVNLKPVRRVKPHTSAEEADAVICIGNKWTASTYSGHCKKIFPINVSASSELSFDDIDKERDYKSARRNFLWFGSYGAVHKGLDLLLDVFTNTPSLNLYICGGVDKEVDFLNFYRNDLLNHNNIHFMGWVKPDSKEYKKIAINCAYSILPSCSEGMSGSIAINMLTGMIPIVSKECGIDIFESGLLLKDCSLDEIEKTVKKMAIINPLECRKMAVAARQIAKSNYSINKFEKSFSDALECIL